MTAEPHHHEPDQDARHAARGCAICGNAVAHAADYAEHDGLPAHPACWEIERETYPERQAWITYRR